MTRKVQGRWQFNFSKKSEERRWKIKDLRYPVGKTATTSLPEYIASKNWTCLGFKLRLQYQLRDTATWTTIASIWRWQYETKIEQANDSLVPKEFFCSLNTCPALTRVSPRSLQGAGRLETLGTRLKIWEEAGKEYSEIVQMIMKVMAKRRLRDTR